MKVLFLAVLSLAACLLPTVRAASPTGCEPVSAQCPAINSGFAIHLPHPTNCGAFCKCDWGKAVYFNCPAGLHFNRVLQVCDWPQYAGCGSSATTKPPTTTTTTTTTTTRPPPPATGCESVSPRCPAVNSGFAIHLPHPTKCGAFCKCDWGNAVYFDCPGGLHFNAVLQVCDWPNAAGCDPSLTTSKASTTTTTTTTTTTRPPPPATGCEPVSARCPAVNSGNAIHLPHPSKCGAFCKCDWGNAVYFDCPGGLHFNPVLQVCDWPNAAGCGGGGSGGSTAVSSTTTRAPPVGLTGCEHVMCPALNGQYALHLPNPFNCTSFCKCDWGKAYFFACPGGLHFNAVKQVCDWPRDAGCSTKK